MVGRWWRSANWTLFTVYANYTNVYLCSYLKPLNPFSVSTETGWWRNEWLICLTSKLCGLKLLVFGFTGIEDGQTVRMPVGNKEIFITFRVSFDLMDFLFCYILVCCFTTVLFFQTQLLLLEKDWKAVFSESKVKFMQESETVRELMH